MENSLGACLELSPLFSYLYWQRFCKENACFHSVESNVSQETPKEVELPHLQCEQCRGQRWEAMQTTGFRMNQTTGCRTMQGRCVCHHPELSSFFIYNSISSLLCVVPSWRSSELCVTRGWKVTTPTAAHGLPGGSCLAGLG